MTRKEILVEAEKSVCGDRNLQYGDPEDNFSDIARLWSAYLDTDLGAEDVAIMMCLFKIARIKGSFYESKDSWVDLIGYAACGGEIATRGEE
jgi:gene 55 protein